MADLDVDPWLSPLSETAPCGPDLEYDPAFQALELAARGKPEQQYGETLIPAEDPDWRVIDEQARALLARTRDLRVLMPWLRARTRLHGLRGFAATLPLAHGWLSQHWDHVHPRLDSDDHDDPTMRLNALAPLADPTTVIADLRAAALGRSRTGLRVRDLELAAGKQQPEAGEAVPSTDGALQALRAAEAEDAGLLQAVRHSHTALAEMDTLLTQRTGTAGPDLRPLRQLTQLLAEFASQATEGTASVAAAGDTPALPDAAASASGPAGSGPLRSREDAIRMLEKACEWIERNEPSNPAPLLIRRAQRLMSKNFLEIIRDLIPDGIEQVTRIAGVTEE